MKGVLFNPISLFGPSLLLFISIPLAIFALITTGFAITALTFRVFVIYIELGFAVIQNWLSFNPRRRKITTYPTTSPPDRPATPASGTASRTSSRHHRRQRSTGAASTSAASSTADLSTAAAAAAAARTPSRRDSWASLVGAGQENRDYEGLGGWRISRGDGADDALWIGMNSRLELPTASHQRHHRRSLTGGSSGAGQRGGSGGGRGGGGNSPEMRMSPVQSRARTPVLAALAGGGADYFDMAPQGGKRMEVYPLAAAAGGKGKGGDPRRKSMGGSSSSSSGSGMGSRAAFKQAFKQAGFG